MASIYTKLSCIQTNMKAPKNLWNDFGKYSYRNAEGILESLKPYLLENSCSVILNDEMQQVGERIYVKATATIVDTVSGESVSTTAYAREEEVKKGMDASQITGCASSYARKYALNGLFLLDDTKDADSNEYHEQTSKDVTKSSKMSTEMEMELKKELQRTGISARQMLTSYRCSEFPQMTCEQWQDVMEKLKKKPNKAS